MELLLDELRNHFYVSMAKVPQPELDKALRIMDKYQSSFMIATRRDSILSEESIKDLFYSGLNKDSHEVDYQALFLKYGLNSEIIFRWGSVVNEYRIGNDIKSRSYPENTAANTKLFIVSSKDNDL